jgi:hypothetical protein
MYINVLTKQLRKQSTGTYITSSQTSKNRVFENSFSPLIDRCIVVYVPMLCFLSYCDEMSVLRHYTLVPNFM